MSVIDIIFALILGFIGGVLGSIVTIESKTETIRKEITDCVNGISDIRNQNKKTESGINALAVAIQRVIESQKRDRGAIWESLNQLWNDYDARHKAASEAKPKKEPEPKKKPAEPKKGKPKA